MRDDNRAELGRLIQEELDATGRGPVEATRHWPVSAQRSFYGWKDGSVVPLTRSRSLLEETFGWRTGVVTEILNAPITRTFTLSEIRDWSKVPEPGVVKAKHLSNAELGSEVVVRLNAAEALREEVERLRAELDELRGASSNVVQLHGKQSHYDLAASDEHVPGEDDRD